MIPLCDIDREECSQPKLFCRANSQVSNSLGKSNERGKRRERNVQPLLRDYAEPLHIDRRPRVCPDFAWPTSPCLRARAKLFIDREGTFVASQFAAEHRHVDETLQGDGAAGSGSDCRTFEVELHFSGKRLPGTMQPGLHAHPDIGGKITQANAITSRGI